MTKLHCRISNPSSATLVATSNVTYLNQLSTLGPTINITKTCIISTNFILPPDREPKPLPLLNQYLGFRLHHVYQWLAGTWQERGKQVGEKILPALSTTHRKWEIIQRSICSDIPEQVLLLDAKHRPYLKISSFRKHNRLKIASSLCAAWGLLNIEGQREKPQSNYGTRNVAHPTVTTSAQKPRNNTMKGQTWIPRNIERPAQKPCGWELYPGGQLGHHWSQGP